MKQFKRMTLALIAISAILVGGIWLLSLALGEHKTLYQERPLEYWVGQLASQDATSRNHAEEVLTTQIIPQLTERMLHDTNDSTFRLRLIEKLNDMPGIRINFRDAAGRRADAAFSLAIIGPPAKQSIPVLLDVTKGHDDIVRGPAVHALGRIHDDPDVVIPELIRLLDDNDVKDEAAGALGRYGTLAKAAVPKLIPMLKIRDKDVHGAVVEALRKIDPDAADQAGVLHRP